MREQIKDLIDSLEYDVDRIKESIEDAINFLEDEAYEGCLRELKDALNDIKSLSETLY